VEGVCEKVELTPLEDVTNVTDPRKCKAGYKDVMCSVCEANYYRALDGRCLACPVDPSVAKFSALVALIAFSSGYCALMWCGTRKHLPSIYVTVTCSQLIAVVARFQALWPPALSIQIHLMQITAFDVNAVNWQCLGTEVSYSETLSVLLAFGLGVLALIIVRALASLILVAAIPGGNRTVISRLGVRLSRAVRALPKGTRPTGVTTTKYGAQQGERTTDIPLAEATELTDVTPIGIERSEAGAMERGAAGVGSTLPPGVMGGDETGLPSSREQSREVARRRGVELVKEEDEAAAAAANTLGREAKEAAEMERQKEADLKKAFVSLPWTTQLRLLLDETTSSLLSVLLLLYVPVLRFTLETVICRRLNDRVSILAGDPSIFCWTGEHAAAWAPALLFSLIFIWPVLLGVPLWVWWCVRDPSRIAVTRRCVFLTQRYERQYWFWEVIIIARGTLLSLFQTVLITAPYTQAFCAALVLIATSGATIIYRPYTSMALLISDTLISSGALLLIFVAMLAH